MKLLSVIIPCYNEEESIPYFYDEIIKIADEMKKDLNFEFIFVDDGSKDNTLKTIKNITKTEGADKAKRVKYISFSRNFGKEAAMYAGLKKSKGDFVVIMDVDLQDPPQMLLDMYKGIIQEKYDCVASRRFTRKGEPPIRSFFAKYFYKLINTISDTQIVDGARDYRMMTRQMVDSILELKEYNRFSKGLFSWVGYNTKWLEFENVERVTGKTTWSFLKLSLYSLEGIIAFSTVPLALASLLGIFICFIAFIYICIVVIKTLIWGDPIGGFPTLISIVSFLGGLQLFCTGIVGQYLSKTYLETKQRPLYIVKEED